MLTLGFGASVALHTLLFKDLRADKLSWKLWALWTVSLFVLPLVRNPAVVLETWQGVVGGLDVVVASSVALMSGGSRISSPVDGRECGTVGIMQIDSVIS